MHAATIKSGATRQISSTTDLRDELGASLQEGFQFDGDYYYDQALSTAPSPGLTIKGIGQVGLPLSERDAKSIVQLLNKPPGRGKIAPRKAKAPRVWEIKSKEVAFENDGWNQYVGKTLSEMIWSGLVGDKAASLPECQLDKILLYEPGSGSSTTKILANQDGTFATAMLILPSSHEGGQVQLTRPDANTRVFDLSAKSSTSPWVLAWYSEIEHIVQPITSGYRLALLFNVIHTCTPSSFPHFPNMDNPIAKFRAALTTWKDSTFGNDERKLNAFAVVLKHTYTSISLKGNGADILDGQDKHLLTYAKDVAEELGFVVILGALDYQPEEPSDDEDTSSSEDFEDYNSYDIQYYYSRQKRARYSCAGYNTTDGIELKLEELVDVDGMKVIGDGKVEIKMENLIPKNVSLTPTEGSAPYGERTTEHFDRHLAMVLLHPDYAEDFLFAGGGVSYALDQLWRSASDTPSESDKKLTRLVVDGLEPRDVGIADAMLSHALRWQDLELWNEVMSKVVSRGHYTLERFGLERPVSALQTFTFKEVCPTFETLLRNNRSLKTRLEFIDAIKGSEKNTEVLQWCKTRELEVLRSFSDPKGEDVHLLVKIAKRRGTPFISKEILPHIAKMATQCHGFLVEFTKALHRKRSDIPTTSSDSADTLEWTPFLDQLLSIAIESCPSLSIDESVFPYHRYRGESYGLQRYVNVLELGIITGRLSTCSKLIQNMLGATGDTINKFNSIYIPFVPKLVKVCNDANLDILTFRELLNQIVSTYLEKILESSSQQHLSKVRKLGCGCKLCVDLDKFIVNIEARDISFKKNKAPRKHLESRIKAATDLLQFRTETGKPCTLIITKTPDIASAQGWPRRQKAAKEFLASVGDNDTLAKLMGDRYNDVQLALSGAKPFVAMPNASIPLAIQLPNLTSTVAVSTGKRKRT